MHHEQYNTIKMLSTIAHGYFIATNATNTICITVRSIAIYLPDIVLNCFENMKILRMSTKLVIAVQYRNLKFVRI